MMSLSMCRKLEAGIIIIPTSMTMQMEDKSIKFPVGIQEDVLVKVGIIYIPH